MAEVFRKGEITKPWNFTEGWRKFWVEAQCGATEEKFSVWSNSVDGEKILYSQVLAAFLSGKKIKFDKGPPCGDWTYVATGVTISD